MIKTGFNAHLADLDELFFRSGFKLASFDNVERDAYTGQLTLSDGEELEGLGATILYIDEGDVSMEYGVSVVGGDGVELECDWHDTLAEALEAYERLTMEHGTNATRLIL